MRFRIVDFSFFCLLICHSLGAQEIVKTDSLEPLATLSSDLIKMINRQQIETRQDLPSFLVSSIYQELNGPVEEFVGYRQDVPYTKAVYNSKGKLLILLDLTKDEYMLNVFKYDKRGKLIAGNNPEISFSKDTLVLLDKSGAVKSKHYFDNKKRLLTIEHQSNEGAHTEKMKYSKNGFLEEWQLEGELKDEAVNLKKYTYEDQALTLVEEYYSNAKGKTKKSKEKKITYGLDGLKAKSKEKKKETKYEYAYFGCGDSTLLKTKIFVNGNMSMEKSSVYDEYNNEVINQTFLAGKLVSDLSYDIAYQRGEDEKQIEGYEDLENYIQQFYYNLHYVIDTISKITTGDGYGRKMRFLQNTKYKLLLTELENRFVEDKSAWNTITLPQVGINRVEEIFQNDKYSFYKVVLNERFDMYFPNLENRKSQLIRIRGRYRDMTIIHKEEEQLKVTVISDDNFIMFKRNKASGLWEIS